MYRGKRYKQAPKLAQLTNVLTSCPTRGKDFQISIPRSTEFRNCLPVGYGGPTGRQFSSKRVAQLVSGNKPHRRKRQLYGQSQGMVCSWTTAWLIRIVGSQRARAVGADTPKTKAKSKRIALCGEKSARVDQSSSSSRPDTGSLHAQRRCRFFLKLSATYPDRQELVKFRAHLHLFSKFLLRAADPVRPSTPGPPEFQN